MSDQLKFPPPLPGEYHEYYESYIARVNPETLEQDFASQPDQFNELLADLPEGEDSKLHEPYTWTLKQLMGHMIDCERIFSTRMLRIASGDTMPMPGMDQNAYVDAMDYNSVTMESLLKEFEFLRKANIELANRLKPESLAWMGTASDTPVSTRANLYILVGHVKYHLPIIKKRLGS